MINSFEMMPEQQDANLLQAVASVRTASSCASPSTDPDRRNALSEEMLAALAACV